MSAEAKRRVKELEAAWQTDKHNYETRKQAIRDALGEG
jgi:hypothetical protein